MTTENFAYWLQGFMEISNTKELDERKTQIIKDHLALVFKKVTPDRDIKEINLDDVEVEITDDDLNIDVVNLKEEFNPAILDCNFDETTKFC